MPAAEVAERLLRVLLHPAGKLGILAAPFGKPGREIAPYLREIAPVIHPAELEQAIVVDLVEHIVERVAQEVHITALPGHAGENLADYLFNRMIVGDDELDAMHATGL